MRSVHSALRAPGSRLGVVPETRGRPASIERAPASCSVSSSASADCHSTSRAAWESTCRPRSAASARGSTCATRSDVASNSSMAAGPEAMISGRAVVARCRSAKVSRAVAACGRTGRVAKVASATNASVPSLPTSRWVSTSIAESWSRNEFSP